MCTLYPYNTPRKTALFAVLKPSPKSSTSCFCFNTEDRPVLSVMEVAWASKTYRLQSFRLNPSFDQRTHILFWKAIIAPRWYSYWTICSIKIRLWEQVLSQWLLHYETTPPSCGPRLVIDLPLAVRLITHSSFQVVHRPYIRGSPNLYCQLTMSSRHRRAQRHWRWPTWSVAWEGNHHNGSRHLLHPKEKLATWKELQANSGSRRF